MSSHISLAGFPVDEAHGWRDSTKLSYLLLVSPSTCSWFVYVLWLYMLFFLLLMLRSVVLEACKDWSVQTLHNAVGLWVTSVWSPEPDFQSPSLDSKQLETSYGRLSVRRYIYIRYGMTQLSINMTAPLAHATDVTWPALPSFGQRFFNTTTCRLPDFVFGNCSSMSVSKNSSRSAARKGAAAFDDGSFYPV